MPQQPHFAGRAIADYAGPYERWVYTPELGRPFAFSAIQRDDSPYFTALLEGAQTPASTAHIECRLPPLWSPPGDRRDITPFAFYDKRADRQADLPDLVAQLGRGMGAQNPRFRVNFPINPATWTPDYDDALTGDTWQPPATKPSAIIAVIDDGIPFANRAFLRSDGRTRVSHVWLQSAAAQQRSGVPFGREICNADIDQLRRDYGTDEPRLYRAAGAVDATIDELGTYMTRHATHGAHIMGLAAGHLPHLADTPLRDDVAIIAVQLPNTIAWDTSGFSKEMYMLSAMHYVFHRAQAIARHFSGANQGAGTPVDEIPLVVNFSYGWSAGRHDGQSEMAIAFQQMLDSRKKRQPHTAIVMPSGNTFMNAMHGVIDGDMLAGGSYDFGWHQPPDDRTSSYLELWLDPAVRPDDMALTITPPAGSPPLGNDSIEFVPDTSLSQTGDPCRYVDLFCNGQLIGQLSVDKHRNSRWRALIALIPTQYTNGEPRRAASGTWTITLTSRKPTGLPSGPVARIWLQRDDDPAELGSGGRQSRLVDFATRGSLRKLHHPLKSYDGTLGFIRGYGALNGVANSADVTRVAGYIAGCNRPANYSGAGGLDASAPWGAQVTLTAVSEDSLAHIGTRSCGVYSGSVMRLIGTSAAAPSAARWMVINAAQGRAFLDGLNGPLPLHHAEDDTPHTRAQHGARVGLHSIPNIGRRP